CHVPILSHCCTPSDELRMMQITPLCDLSLIRRRSKPYSARLNETYTIEREVTVFLHSHPRTEPFRKTWRCQHMSMRNGIRLQDCRKVGCVCDSSLFASGVP